MNGRIPLEPSKCLVHTNAVVGPLFNRTPVAPRTIQAQLGSQKNQKTKVNYLFIFHLYITVCSSDVGLFQSWQASFLYTPLNPPYDVHI